MPNRSFPYAFLAPALLAVALIRPGAAAAAEGQIQISDVIIEGAQKVHPDHVLFRLTVRQGKSYAQRELYEAMSDDVRSILAIGPFGNVAVEPVFAADGRSARIVYRFRELPYVVKVEVAGVGYFKREAALKLLTTRQGGYLNDLLVESDRRAIQRKFQDDGYRFARVETRVSQVDGNASLVFHVDLGREVLVGNLVFENLPPGARPRFFDEVLFNTKGKPYQPELMAQDSSAVVRAMQDNGWLDAKLATTRAEVTDFVRPADIRRRMGPELVPDGVFNDRVVLVFALDAGSRYRLGQVTFQGEFTAATHEQLRAAFSSQDTFGRWVTIPEGEWYVRRTIDDAVERSRRLISNQGYARCDITVDRQLDLDTRTVNLRLTVFQGNRYRIGRIDIHGNRNTRDAIARRALAIGPGDWWSDDAVDESKRQIQRTGLYENTPQRPLRIHPRFDEERPDEADVVIDIDEAKTGTFSVQLGYSSAVGVYGQLGLGEQNFNLWGLLTEGFSSWRGAGERFNVNLFGSIERKSISASWTNPKLLDGPYALSVSGYRYDSSLNNWDEVRIGGSPTISRSFLNNDVNLSLGYAYTDLEISDIASDAPTDAAAGKRFLNSWTLGQSYDRLNNPILPTAGFALKASETVYGAFMPSSADILDYNLRGDGYLPLLRSEDGGVTYFHLSADWRRLYALGETDRVPFYQRVFGGGPAPRHRGFDVNRLGPTAINGNGIRAREGGDKDLLFSGELSFPIQGTNDGLRFVTFADVGNVWGEGESARFGDLRTAIGIGVRFPIQLPVALDFAWLVDAEPGESASQIHFGIGQIRY